MKLFDDKDEERLKEQIVFMVNELHGFLVLGTIRDYVKGFYADTLAEEQLERFTYFREWEYGDNQEDKKSKK